MGSKMSEERKARWARMTPEQREAHIAKSVRAGAAGMKRWDREMEIGRLNAAAAIRKKWARKRETKTFVGV